MQTMTPKRTVIVTTHTVYGEAVSPGVASGPMRTTNGAGEIVEVYYRGGSAQFIPDIPAALDPYGTRPTPVPPTREIDATLLSDGPT